MTSQPVEANVVLTTDNTQYDQAMMASAGSTDSLGRSVDTLGSKLAKLTKTAGRTLIGISAADVATITAATAAYTRYEKEVSLLNAQSAILARTQTQQTRVMKDYTTAVAALRTEYGSTTREAAALVQTLSKVTNIRASRDLSNLSKVFEDMSKATGESSVGLASSLTNLQKVMGTPITSATTRKYADQFTYLAAQTNASATQLIDFTTALAPMGKAIHLNQTQIAGFATGFAKAGADGYAAANVFTKVAYDISKSMATGSPEIAHYANLIGVTNQRFKEMKGADQLLAVFEAISNMGPRATVELDRLGLDGTRSLRQIQAVLNQPGGLRQALGLAQEGASSNAAAKGRAAAMTGLSDEWAKLTQNIQQTAEALGKDFMPVMEAFVGGMVRASGVIKEMVEGPFGRFMSMVMEIIAPFAGGAGALLLFSGALMKLAATFTLFRNSASLGVWEGLRGGGRIGGSPETGFYPIGSDWRKRGEQIAERGSPFQRTLYNAGQMAGGGARGLGLMMQRGWEGGRGFVDPGYQPQSRGALSYMAGGAGRAIGWFGTPIFDQMRYANPADRHLYPEATRRILPNLREQWRLASGEQAMGTAQYGIAQTRKAEAEVRAAPLLSTQEREAQAERLRQIRAEHEEALTSAREQVRTARENIAATKEQTQAVGASTKGFAGLARNVAGYTAGFGGGVLGAGKWGANMIRQSPMAWPLGGTMALAGGSALGLTSSNMFTMGAVGSMFGPAGAGVGITAGAIMDMAQANNKAAESTSQLREQYAELLRSGSGFTEMNKSTADTSKAVKDNIASIENAHYWDIIIHPKNYFGNVKNTIEGWLGTSDVQEARDAYNQTADAIKNAENAARDLAELSGVNLTGTAKNQRQQLDQFMSTAGAARLSKAGVDFEQLVTARQFAQTGNPAMQWTYQLLLDQVRRVPTRVDRLEATPTGRFISDIPAVQRSLNRQENYATYYKAINAAYQGMQGRGMSNADIIGATERLQAGVRDENSQSYAILTGISGLAQQSVQAQLPMMTRAQQFGTVQGQYQQLLGIPVPTKEQTDQLENAKQASIASYQDQAQYFKQLLLMQDQYQLSRSRAEEDYSLQRSYSLHDYNLSRDRSEQAFNRSRRREIYDYHISVSRAWYEFHLQRSRQQDDFNHQVQLQAKQMAATAYNPYQRVVTQRTSGVDWTLNNAKDILQRLRDQRKNLNELRRLGFSDAVIQQLSFTDPANAQQLARFVEEAKGDQSLVGRYNRVARQTVRAARALVTDPSNPDWKEALHQFRLSRDRAREDMNRSMDQGRDDFRRGLARQRKDYNIMMGQQAEDFQTQMQRQEDAYHLQMNRAAQDMARVGKEISGSLESILERASNRLTGHAQKQAQVILRTFRDLKTSTEPEAVALMASLSSIFGFKYQAPKGVNTTPVQMGDINRPGDRPGTQVAPGGANGMIVPGWTPGRDVQYIKVSGGEAIMRPEWTRAVGEKNVEAMNHQARHGGFFLGGVMPLTNATYSQHTSGYPWARWAGDLNYPGYADYGKPIHAWRSGIARPFDYHADRSYGRGQVIESGGQSSLYAHMSRVLTALAGRQVRAGQVIGYVGDYGNTGTPPTSHLHFEIRGGKIDLGDAEAGPQPVRHARLRDVTQRRYPAAEAAAYAMQGVHPLNRGDISTILNRYARRAWNRLSRKYGSPSQVTPLGEAVPPAPEDVHGNQALVRKAMLEEGWHQWDPLYQLVMHESGFNNTAQNPTSTAYGMFQFLDSTWDTVHGKKTSDPWLQSVYGMRYIKQRYHDPAGAWNFWRNHQWYGDGSVFTKPTQIGVGERGPEAVIPLNDRGANFMTEVMGSMMGGRNVIPARAGGTNVFATKIDRSTNFTGPITVQANDPQQLISKLQARQRVMALSRPSLTGSAA